MENKKYSNNEKYVFSLCLLPLSLEITRSILLN